MNDENAQGIEVKIIRSAIVNQIAIVLNFALSVCLRFASAEPIVIITIAIIIIRLCSIPKKRTAL